MKYLLWKPAALLLLAVAAGTAQADTDRLRTQTRYDVEYPVMGYSGPATKNRIWRLQQDLDSGAVRLQWEPGFGYLRSLLKALQIEPDSQVLVFSRTSLQIEHISARTPRAVYFNGDTYIGYVHDSPLIEIAAIDAEKGAVFYGFDNRQDNSPTRMEREGGRCLTCHDTYSMMGGGVPRVMVMSAPVEDASDKRTYSAAEETDDRTPLTQRWGGWYVTGSTGAQAHFGNLSLREERGVERLRELAARRMNIETLREYFDTSTYLTDKSDVAALLVLEHQTAVQNLITRVNYKVRTVMAREEGEPVSGDSAPRSWDDIKAGDQKRIQQMIEPLVRALFFQEAAPLGTRVTGSSGFAERFSKQGPRDSKGRGLQELDLNTRLMRHPLSFMVYSEQFDALPGQALDYLNGRIVEVLRGTDTSGIAAKLTAAERTAITQILIDTKPALAQLLREPPRR